MIVTEGIHDRFVAAMIEKMKTLKVDDARKAGTDIGPVVDDRQLAQDLEYIAIGQKGRRQAARRRSALDQRRRRPRLTCLRPALFTETTPRCASTAKKSLAPWSASSA